MNNNGDRIKERRYFFIDDYTTVKRYIMKNNKFIPYNRKEDFSLAQQIWSIYIEKGNGINANFASMISFMNDKRNTFVHNKPMVGDKSVHNDIYKPKAFHDLFKIVDVILIELGNIYNSL